jgi:FAD dependent oxidoreductase
MNRRTFVRLSGFAPFTTSFAVAADLRPREYRADVAIIGGGLGGVAAALAAARAGLHVVMTEETDWIGGQLTAQAVPPDEHRWIESFGCSRSYRQLRNGIRDYYRRNYPLSAGARAAGHLNPGNGSVSRLCCEPRVALAVLHEMLAPNVSSGRIEIWLRHEADRAIMAGDCVKSVRMRSIEANAEIELQAEHFLDATELGTLLAVTKTEFVTGAESQKDTGEPHAPSEAQPTNQQAFTSCFAVDYLPGEDHGIDRPPKYQFWRDYVPKLAPPWTGKLLSWSMCDPRTLKERAVGFNPTGGPVRGMNLWNYRRIADRKNFTDRAYRSDICLVNWPQNDYWLGTLVPNTPAATAAKELSLSLLYWMQTEAPRPDGGTGWKGLRLRRDIVGTADGLAKMPYIRESRRIKAEFTVLEQHVGVDARMKTTGRKADELTAERFADTVGIGHYRIDLHPSTGGDNYIDVASLPFQIPLGALVPVRIENLLPACKNLGVTHITNGCYRLHPVEWSIGEAAGALAAYCLRVEEPPRHVRNNAKHLERFQAALRNDGVELEWPESLPK